VNADMHEYAGRFLAAVGESPARKKILDFEFDISKGRINEK
jgi:hypothetical protein